MLSKVNYPITFKAAILENTKKPFVIDEITFNGPLQFGQVLVKYIIVVFAENK